MKSQIHKKWTIKYLTYSVFRKSYRFWENECSDCNQFGNDNYPFCNKLNNTPQIRNGCPLQFGSQIT